MFPALDEWRETRPAVALFDGLAGSSPSFLVSQLFDFYDAPVFVLAESGKRCESIARECASILGQDCSSVFPSRDAIPYNQKSPFGPTIEARFKALSQLMSGEKRIFVAPSIALLQKIPPQKALFNRIIRLHVGDILSQTELAAWLSDNGFKRETMADTIGTFAIRGNIFDIYPFMTEHPVRLDFFGDTLESIRLFDVFSQKSIARRNSVELYPMSEFHFSDSQISTALNSMRAFCRAQRIDEQGVRSLEHAWKTLADYDGIEWFLHWFEQPAASILDFLPRETCVVWMDTIAPHQRLAEHIDLYSRHRDRVADPLRPLVSPPAALLHDPDSIMHALSSFPRIFINTTGADTAHMTAYHCETQEQPSFPASLDPLFSDLQARNSQGYDVHILCENIGHAERIREIVSESCPFVIVSLAYIDRGFIDRLAHRVVYAENQIFNRPHHHPPSKKFKTGVPISGFDTLSPGDYVVHIDHGIGRFNGIERIKACDVQRDCMVVQYQDAAKLYVPVEDFHKVQKYIGKESSAPTLSKLGTQSWEKLKRRTRGELKEMARELIELYGKRQYLDGIQFSADSLWQKEFEDAFLYEETPDQRSAIADVKRDMEARKPMDRLICGDVGFGKTEVAMRAAFKAVSDGYQVAVLAPTTILVAQHYATFRERMAAFPIAITMLSRFLGSKEQRDTVARLKSGDIDIVIGTHRLLSNDVAFKNLGLLIIDEEQRFGVRHKEKLKHYRYTVDVLSMTATPIPRTLHLSLIGARDLSIINTPPANRLPIDTRVMEFHDQVLKDALENELERGGQVYVVDNRIANLYSIRDKIEQLVPRARVAVAHGQMEEKELAAIMKAFVAGTLDVLVSTVIIENGLDIPNVNTIVVLHADAMGLSQLYQLRGRVGRSSEQAFAYLLTPPFKEVHDESLKRLRALEQYTELGSGFQIAMRDLEIRGAGNILGLRQHGFIAAVGFELYCRLLKEAVDEIKGEKPAAQAPEIKVDIPLEAFLPPEYIPDPTSRVSVYQHLASSTSIDSVSGIESELLDRFGPLPPQASSLLLLIRVKILASSLGACRIGFGSDGVLEMAFDGADAIVSENVRRLISGTERRFEVVYGTPVVCKTPLRQSSVLERAMEVYSILESVHISQSKSPA